MARITNAQVLGALTEISTVLQGFDARLTALEGKATVAAASPKGKANTRKPKAAPAPVAVRHEFTGQRVENGTRKLTRANREAFIKAHGWATQGMSTNALRNAVAAGARVNKGWNVAI